MGFLDETGLSSFFTKLKTAYFTHMVSDTTFQTVLTDYLQNNGTTTAQGYALDARYGKTLKDSVDSLNSNKVGKTFSSTDLSAYLQNNGITTANGYALDARYGKTLADEISALNSSSTYKSGDTVNFYGVKAIGRITTAGNQAYVSLQLPKAIDADSVSVTLTMANVFGVSGSTSASSFTVNSIGISKAIGQVHFAFPIQTSMTAGSVCVVEMSGSITFS